MSPNREMRGLSSPAERRRAHDEPVGRAVSAESQEKLQTLQDDLGQLQESMLLQDAHRDLEEISATLTLLPTEIEHLRNRGYVFRSFLEKKVQVLTNQWQDTSQRVSREVPRLTRELQREADEAERALDRAMAGGTVHVSRAETAVKALEHRLDGAKSTVSAMYQTLQQNVTQTKSQIEEITWLLDQLDEATFQLRPTEDPIAACKAQLMETKKDRPKGILYLTDERLIFEQKEKKATKKVLFLATAKETIQELIFDVPVGHIEKTETSQKGLLGRREMMNLIFAPEALLNEALIRLQGADNEDWAGLIGRVKSGEIDKERSRPEEEAVVEAVRDIPTKCPTCGASLDVEIVRGMHEITCDYCGTVIRL